MPSDATDYASAACTDCLLYRWSVHLTRHTFLGHVLANKHGPQALNTPLKVFNGDWTNKGLFFSFTARRRKRETSWNAHIQWRGIGYSQGYEENGYPAKRENWAVLKHSNGQPAMTTVARCFIRPFSLRRSDVDFQYFALSPEVQTLLGGDLGLSKST